MISSPCLKKQVTNVSPESFELFLYVQINRKYQKHALFTQFLICIYVDSSKTIIKDLDLIDLNGIPPLCNNMIKPPLLEDWTTF